MKKYLVKKTLGLLTLAGTVAFPSFITGVAQAQAELKHGNNNNNRPGGNWNNGNRPGGNRPGGNWNNGNKPGGNWNNGNKPGGNWNNGSRVTIRGTVTRGSESGLFRIRDANNGQNYTVRSNGRTVVNQRLIVTGTWQNGIIQATNVDRWDGNNPGNPGNPIQNDGSRISVRGTVTRGSDSGVWRLRDAYTNREYVIRSNGRTVAGQRLQVDGVWQRSMILASKVDRWDGNTSGGNWNGGGWTGGHNNNNNNNNNGQNISITATVIQGSNSGAYRVRADGNGQVYNVRSSGRTVNGQRLKIRGNLRNGILYATNVDKA
jgi:hypothetical protein